MIRLLFAMVLIIGPCTPADKCEAGKRWDGVQCVACQSMQECL